MLINEKITFGNVTARNRVLFQPMEGCDGTVSGGIGELTRRRYMRFAGSGAGTIWFEATAVTPEGRANPRQLWLTEDNADEFKRLIEDIKNESVEKFGFAPIIIMQATHSGRYSKPNGTPEPIIAYRNAVFEKGKESLPYRIITDDECAAIPEKYYNSARLAARVGFDGIDVKCCHGYLFNEFLSAFTREGNYGGCLENRTRLYFECIDAAKSSIKKDMFVTTRLNGYDGFDYPYGFAVDKDNNIDLTETKWILRNLQEKGLELVDITIGNPYLIPSVNRPFIGGTEDGMIGVNRIVNITGELQNAFPDLKIVMSGLTYLGTDAISFANDLLEQGKCSVAGFGRMTFAYPEFYRDFCEKGELDKNKVCIKCGNCSKMMRAGGVAGCPVRDKEVYMPLYREYVEKK